MTDSKMNPEQPPATVGGVVLAAGSSSRLQGPLKQLLPFRGRPLLEETLRVLGSVAGLAEIVVVLGHQAELIARSVALGRARVSINREYAAGQSTSMRAGLAALRPETAAALFVLGDMPSLRAEV